MKVGFTGTQAGMTAAQKSAVEKLLLELDPDEFHHGDCIGADNEADSIALMHVIATHVHPPVNPSKRAWCEVEAVKVYPKKPYLERNKDIVDACNVLIAAPKEMRSTLRSGTWATIRYAMARRPTCIIWPDGTVSRYRWDPS